MIGPTLGCMERDTQNEANCGFRRLGEADERRVWQLKPIVTGTSAVVLAGEGRQRGGGGGGRRRGIFPGVGRGSRTQQTGVGGDIRVSLDPIRRTRSPDARGTTLDLERRIGIQLCANPYSVVALAHFVEHQMSSASHSSPTPSPSPCLPQIAEVSRLMVTGICLAQQLKPALRSLPGLVPRAVSAGVVHCPPGPGLTPPIAASDNCKGGTDSRPHTCYSVNQAT